jgi:tetratricopeptide (TPR) repeat protein
MDKDSSYAFGFIYIDEEAGLTLHYEGKFNILSSGIFLPKRLDSTNIIYRLVNNQVVVATIPEDHFDELKIKKYPEWLRFYETDTGSIKRLFRWGFLYNSWDMCPKALEYLEKAQKIDPKYKGLAFELAFAYNSLAKYDMAITVLNSAIQTSPKECYLYKELSYSEIKLGQLDNASKICKIGIPLCSENEIKCEIAYNLAYEYYKNKDELNFKYWAAETKKYSTPGDRFITNINLFENKLLKL